MNSDCQGESGMLEEGCNIVKNPDLPYGAS